MRRCPNLRSEPCIKSVPYGRSEPLKKCVPMDLSESSLIEMAKSRERTNTAKWAMVQE
jgi:hypothetical protein